MLTAYSPLAKARRMHDPALLAIAAKYRATPAQVLIRWGLQRGFVSIPKSTKAARIEENRGVDFEIREDDMRAMSGWNANMVTGWDPTKSA